MDSLVGYGSDDENDNERYTSYQNPGSVGGTGGSRRRDDDTNYDDVNMDMSEDSNAESEPELPPAEPSSSRSSKNEHRGSDDNRNRNRDRERERDYDRRERRKDSPSYSRSDRADRRSPRRDDKYRSDKDKPAERSRGGFGSDAPSSSRRGLLGDRPDDKLADKVPALMDLKPFGGEPPPQFGKDARDAVSPRFTDRSERRDRDRDNRGERSERGDRGDRERDRDRDRERERHGGRRSEERWSGRHSEYGPRPRGAAFPPPSSSSSSSCERRGSPPGDYRPSSYKVNKKLEVMEKMGLQIKTPDGSMATAQQLRAAASDAPHPAAGGGLPSYYNPTAVNTNKILDQVQKRKLLWSNKNKSEAEEAAKWSGTRFAQDNDGKQVSKFMRLMGIKEPESTKKKTPAAVKPEPVDKNVDPIKKQEELFQAMQAQYEVARATTHTMRGVGLGFQRGQY